MRRSISIVLIASLTACSGPRVYVASESDGVEANRIANLERAARYPWTDDGVCAVREASGEWRALVERCYHALDLSRIRFHDQQHRCAVADVDAAAIQPMVGICLLVQPELVVGAVVIVGLVIVAAAITAELAKAKKPGCRCKCFRAGELYTDFLRVRTPLECQRKCDEIGYPGWECK